MKITTVLGLALYGFLLLKFGPAVIPPILIIGLIVLIHEYGHYTLMRRNGVQVEEFFIGFGPTLYERQLKSGTMFRVRLFLIGGAARPAEGAIEGASTWARVKIYMAGMFFNACAAFVAFTILFYWTRSGPAEIVTITNSLHVPRALRPLVAAFLSSFGVWLATPALVCYGLMNGIASFFSGAAGPIGIAQMGASGFGHGRSALELVKFFLGFFAVINVAVAGMNLLPLFPLDGGRVVDELLGKLPGKLGMYAVKAYRGLTSVVIFALILSILLIDFWRMLPRR